MNEKWFTFHWNDGTTTYGKGKNVAEASNISVGGLGALDYYEETKELPDNLKEIRIILLNGENYIAAKSSLLVEEAMPLINKNMKEISVKLLKTEYHFKVQKTEFEYILTEY